MDLNFPYKGYSKGAAAERQPANTTPWIQNMRVIDCQDNRFRGGQRGGLKRAYTEQIGGAAKPVMVITSITIVD